MVATQQAAADASQGSRVNHFRPLRRKLGVVTILMACMFMAGWARTLHDWKNRWEYDFSPKRHWLVQFVVFRGVIECRSLDFEKYQVDRSESILLNLKLKLFTLQASIADSKPFGVTRIRGFDIGEDSRLVDVKATIYRTPIVALVIPLTLLSAYLLLSKPRQGLAKETA